MRELKIIRTNIANSNDDYQFPLNESEIDHRFDTRDAIYTMPLKRGGSKNNDLTPVCPSDYAILNGAKTKDNKNGIKHWQTGYKSLRSVSTPFGVDALSYEGHYAMVETYDRSLSVVSPRFKVDIDSFISSGFASKITTSTIDGLYMYNVVDLGLTYPQDYVGIQKGKKLAMLYKEGMLPKTGNTYLGHRGKKGYIDSYETYDVINDEYELDGRRYVRIDYQYDPRNNVLMQDGTSVLYGGFEPWVEVQPIMFKILNWDNLPTSINPDGDGTAKYVEVESEKGLMGGLPFIDSPNQDSLPLTRNETRWQNSYQRAYLNSYDLHKEIDRGNGIPKFKYERNISFANKGFLEEATQLSKTKVQIVDDVLNLASSSESNRPLNFESNDEMGM